MFLEGLPNLQQLGKLKIGEHTAEMLQCNLDFEMEQITTLKNAIALCEQEQFLITNTGIENYLQSMMEA